MGTRTNQLKPTIMNLKNLLFLLIITSLVSCNNTNVSGRQTGIDPLEQFIIDKKVFVNTREYDDDILTNITKIKVIRHSYIFEKDGKGTQIYEFKKMGSNKFYVDEQSSFRWYVSGEKVHVKGNDPDDDYYYEIEDDYLVLTFDRTHYFAQDKKNQNILNGTRYYPSRTMPHSFVDLGLSVKWATCNVGATSPEKYGNYYSWGETDIKDEYSSITYQYSKGSPESLTKYCNNSKYGNNGFIDNLIKMDLNDDIAYINWGEKWRIPTTAEFQELIDNCTWTWINQDGVDGYKITSNKTGFSNRSIFLPAAGEMSGPCEYGNSGCFGYYWCNTIDTDFPYYASHIYFLEGLIEAGSDYRSNGFTIRPVCP